MAEEKFGTLGDQDFKDLRSATSEIANLAAEQQRVLRSLGEGTSAGVNALQQQVRVALDLAGITAEELKSKNALSKLENIRIRNSQSLAKLQTEERDRVREVERLASSVNLQRQKANSLTGAAKRQAEEELMLRENSLASAQEGLDIAREAVKSGQQLLKSTEDLLKVKKIVDSQTQFFDKLESAVKAIPAIGDALSGPFSKASAAAKEMAEKGAGRMNANLAGATTLVKELATMLGPVAVLGALFKVSDQVAQINRQLGLGTEAATRTRDRFAEIAQSSGSSRFNTEKLVQANTNLNQALGTSVEFSGEMLKSFIELTEYMGVSNEAAAKLATLGKTTGQTSSEFAGNLALSVANANRANGVFVSTASAFEKIKNLSATTLLNLRRNPQALGEAIVLTEKLGLSFEQLKSTSQSLLDFESSISNELEAELLTGRELNLERARSAALRGDDVTLARELARQVGNVAEFERMNVIQRESLAKAFGMSADQMGEMLIKQELMNKLGNEAKNLTNEQAAAIKKMIDDNPGMTPQQALVQLQTQESATKKFQDAVAKLKNVFTDIVSFLTPIIDKFGGFVSSIASSGLAKLLVGGGIILSLGAALKNMIMPRGSSPANPLYVSSSMGGGEGGLGGMLSTLPGGGRYAAAMRANRMGKFGMSRAMGMKGVGIGALAAVAGMGAEALSEQYEEGSAANVGFGVAGGALEGAGAGASIGSFIPGIGTLAGAGIGAAIGGLVAYLEKKDKQEEEGSKTSNEKYDQMIKLLQAQSQKDTKIFMDSNQVGIGLALGNPRLN